MFDFELLNAGSVEEEKDWYFISMFLKSLEVLVIMHTK